jgi:hypothetical protein
MGNQLKEKESLNPVYAISSARISNASGARDKVWALTGLFNKKLIHEPWIAPNYFKSMSTSTVYTAFAQLAVQTGFGADLLLHAGTSQQIQDLPTWVPDWSFEPRRPLHGSIYTCASKEQLQMKVIDRTKLLIKASLIDKLCNLAHQGSYADTLSSSDNNGNIPAKDLALYHAARLLCQSLRAKSRFYIGMED